MKYMKFLGSRERSSDACHRNSRAGAWAQSKFKRSINSWAARTEPVPKQT
jgi:hypothetical protein